MKKLILLLLVLLSIALKATNYMSVANGNWSSSATWSPTGVPGATDTATIANTVTLNANESIFTIIINSGKTLTVSSSNTLTVDGSFTNNGTFTPSTGIVNFDGTGAQSLGGSMATTFYELEEYGTGTVTLGNNITVSYYFVLEGGTFDVSTSNYSITLNGAYDYFYNTFTSRSGTVNFANTGNTYVLNSTSSSIPFYNVVVYGTLYCNYGIMTLPNITVNSGKQIVVYQSYVGNIVNNGTFTTEYITDFPYTGTFMSGTGLFNESGSGVFYFYNSPVTIPAGITFNAPVYLDVADADRGPLGANHGIVLTNLGILSQGIYVTNGTFTSARSTVINGSTGSITATAASGLLTANDTVDASTAGNSITYIGTAGTTRIFKNNTLYNFTADLTSGTLSLGSNLIIANNLTINAGTTLYPTTNNYNLTIGGNFTNNASFASANATVIFNGSHNQLLEGTVSNPFYNLTLNQAAATDTLFLGKTITVNNNLTQTQGVLYSEIYQITGNTSGTYTMASGTTLLLGLKSSSTTVTFPTSFTNANCSLNANSNVVYQANSGSQTISAIPTYGNLIIGKGTASLSGTLNIGGSLTTNSSTTFTATTNTVNLTGNLVNNGILSFSTGTLNIGGNLTNNGTFTTGTNTVVFDGTGSQSITSVHSSETFQNLTVNSSSNVTSNCNLNINANNFVQSGGTLTIE